MKGSIFVNPVLYKVYLTGKVYVQRKKKTGNAEMGWFQPVKHYDNTPKAIRYRSTGPLERWPINSMVILDTPSCS